MRKAIAALGLLLIVLILCAGIVKAQREENQPRYDPVEVVFAEEAVYPANAVYWGTVVLQVAIDKEGAIGEVKVVRDSPPFTKEALTAIKKWKFKPAHLDGKPVRSNIAVAFSFNQPAIWNPRRTR